MAGLIVKVAALQPSSSRQSTTAGALQLLRLHQQRHQPQPRHQRQQACTSSTYPDRPYIIRNPTTANLKRGTGGRSSYSGVTCTVFGASGFIGNYLVGRLGRVGTQIIIPYRGDHYDVAPLKVCGDLGQILYHPFHLRDEDSILKCIKYSDVVVNLIGREWETRNFTYEDVNTDGAARIARLCKEAGVPRLIHVSRLNAHPDPKKFFLPEGSKLLKTKWAGECAVRQEFPDVTVVRPSDVYGTEDYFIRTFSPLFRTVFRDLGMHKDYECVVKQPIWVGDVVAGLCTLVQDPKSAGKTYQFVGPHPYKLVDILNYLYAILAEDNNQKIRICPMNEMFWPMLYLKLFISQNLTWTYPPYNFTWESLEKEHTSDVVLDGIPTIEDLGITPIPIDDQFAWEARPYTFSSSYQRIVGEFFTDLRYPKPLVQK